MRDDDPIPMLPWLLACLLLAGLGLLVQMLLA